MPVLHSKLDLKDSVFQQNKADMEATLEELQALYDEAAAVSYTHLTLPTIE